MMDYSTATDDEINSAVHIHIHGNAVSDFDKFFASFPIPDYCNSWADAGPIIESKRIQLTPLITGGWQAVCGANGRVFKAENESPLIAAMIVFLMMQEGIDVAQPHDTAPEWKTNFNARFNKGE